MTRSVTLASFALLLLLNACAANGGNAPASSPSADLTASIVPGAGHGLSGHMLLIARTSSGAPRLTSLDLAAGRLSTLFDPPEHGWLASAALSPDGRQVAMAYGAPSDDPNALYGYTDLYLMPADASAPPRIVVQRSAAQEYYATPVWSPDGQWLYFAHFTQEGGGDGAADRYAVERIAPAGGKPEALVEHGIWPSLSRDGKRLAYVQVGATDDDGNALVVADSGGGNPAAIVPMGAFEVLDAPAFSQNNATLAFSAANPEAREPASSWLDGLFGVQVALAHDAPADLWTVPVTGGRPERLIVLGKTGIYPAFSPDGTRIAFASTEGLFLLNRDGSGLSQILNTPLSGSLSWQP